MNAHQSTMRLYSRRGKRLYLNESERTKLKAVIANKEPAQRALALCLLYTGCRISEAIALETGDIQYEEGTIAITSLKKRSKDHVREVPIPQVFVDELEALGANRLFWPVCRTTAWRWIKAMMQEAGIEGDHATAKGLRHSFGVSAALNNVPITLTQKWMGHTDIKTTAIYSQIVGKEERAVAERMWV